MRRTICIACGALLLLLPLSCSDDETPVAPAQGGADVSGVLIIPNTVDDMPYAVWIDTDMDPDNGYVKMTTGLSGTETEVPYSLGTVPAGTYFLYSRVCILNGCLDPTPDGPAKEPRSDSYWGVYGIPLEITSITPESGPVGTQVTLVGGPVANAVVPKNDAVTFNLKHHIYNASEVNDERMYIDVNGYTCDKFCVSETQGSTTFLMPNAGSQGQHWVHIRYRGMYSDAVSWMQEGDGDPSEPGNNDPWSCPMISIPHDFVGSFHNGDVVDFCAFTVSATTTLSVVLDWNTYKNLDMVIIDSNYELISVADTTNRPEVMQCNLDPGNYYFGVGDISGMDGDTSLVSYRATITLLR